MTGRWSRSRKWAIGLTAVGVGASTVWYWYRHKPRASTEHDNEASTSGRPDLEDMLLFDPNGLSETRQQDVGAHLAHHFESVQDIVDATTMPSLLPALGAAVAQCTGVVSLLDTLRGGEGVPALTASAKLVAWEDLKRGALAQLLLTIHLLPLLALTVRCQLSVLGRYLYLESALEEVATGPAPRLSTPSQERFLAFADHLAREGHAMLAPAAMRAASAAIADRPLHAALDAPTLIRVLSAALERLAQETALLGPTAWESMALPSPAAASATLALAAPDDRALMPGAEGLLVDVGTVEAMLGEVRTTLQSPRFAYCLKECTAAAAAQLATAFSSRVGTASLPLAKALPIMVAVNDEAYGPVAGLAPHLASLSTVKQLAAAVYACCPGDA